jgi:hypothetical protein
MLNVNDFYDPIKDAPAAAFANIGDVYAGTVVVAEMRDDPYGSGQVPVFVLRLDQPSDDEEYLAVWARSPVMIKEIAKRANRAGRQAVTEGDWLRVELIAERESSNGSRPYKIYAAQYECGGPDDETDSGAGEFVVGIGTGEFVAGDANPQSLFGDDEPPF